MNNIKLELPTANGGTIIASIYVIGGSITKAHITQVIRYLQQTADDMTVVGSKP